MNQVPQNPPAQGDPGNEELETRRSKCLTEVLSYGIVNIMRHSVATERAFFCRSDLIRLWSEKPGSGCRSLDTVFYHLSEGQREVILEKLLLFISFLVFEDVSPNWFTTCGSKLFGQQWQQSTQLEFEDSDGPISEEHLRELGLTPTQAAHWQEQYMFRPARIRFDPDVWRQEIDPCEPLPFEKVPQDNPTGSMVHVEDGDSTGYYSEFGTVHLYRIPEECVVDVRRGSEEWIPRTSTLRIIKSFIASTPALEEAKNMEFLKGSLTQNKSIETHDAIIERKQEDHARISIILPYASLGDLSQFLVDGSSDVSQPPTRFYDFEEKFPRVEETGYELDLSLLKQSAQLADALKFLHEGFRTVADDWKVFCAHMDLKPANIIICLSSDGIVGKWKLCDFGISVFYAEQKGLRGKVGSIGDYFNKVLKTTKRSPRRPPGTFTAPEVEFLASSDSEDPLSSDIWSFGAIFSEILAYSSGRSASVKRFRQLRTKKTYMRRYPDDFFYTWMPENIHHTSYSGCILRGEVSDWLDEFAVDIPPSSPPAACHKCWATCIKSILEAQPKKRPKAAQLDHWIESLYKHTTKSEENTCITTFPNRLKADSARRSLSSAHDSLGSIFSTPQDQTPSTTSNLVDSHTSSSSGNHPRTERKPQVLFKPNVIKPIISPYALGSSGGPRRPSNEHLSQVMPLELTSTDVIDYDLDGYKMAFLCKNDFRVFRLSPMKHAMGFINHEVIPLVEKEQQWKGISIAGDYLVVWGVVSNVPVLRVYDISNGPVPRQGPGTLPYFNPKKRVAISRQGYVAMINNNFIHIVRASDQIPYRKIEMPRQGKFRNFHGVSFDNAGSILYAWGNQDSIYGALFVYEFTREQDPEVPIFNGKYQDDFDGHNVVIMPFQGQNDCIIAVGPRFFIACVDRDRREHVLRRTFTQARQNLNEQGLMPQHMFGPFPGPDTVAACMFDSSLILVQSTRSGRFASSKNWTGRICQQLLDPHEMPDMAALRQVANLRERPKTDQKAGIDITVKVGVIQLNETDIFIVVCHKEGKVELVPLIQESQDTY